MNQYALIAAVALVAGMVLGGKAGESRADKKTYMACSKYGQAELVDGTWLIKCEPKKEPQ